MADVRALLKAKREQRVSHPFASYNASGQLRCSACGIQVKHASAWQGHLGSKGHRTSVARLKEEENRKGKRKAEFEDVDTGDMDVDGGEDSESKKRRVEAVGENQPDEPPSSNGFPTNFFSDPSRAPPLATSSDDEDDDAAPTQPLPLPPPPATSTIDAEWEAFERSVLSAPKPISNTNAYVNATIFAEPELIDAQNDDGFPASVISKDAPAPAEEEKEETEDDIRKRKAQEERELIMDRILDEERAQEEADDRVVALKARLEFIKQKRAAAKAAKGKS